MEKDRLLVDQELLLRMYWDGNPRPAVEAPVGDFFANSFGIRSEVTSSGRGTANIKLFVDKNQSGVWELVLETKDQGSAHGSAPFLSAGHAGNRTDFMDVEFKDYKIE